MVCTLILKKENAHDDPIYCCAWSETRTSGDTNIVPKEYLVTGGLDCLIKVWKFEHDKLELLHILKGHLMAVVSLAVSPDGFTLASTSLESTLIIWDLLSGNKVHMVPTGAVDAWQVTFSPEGSQLVSGSHNGRVKVYGVEKGTTDMVMESRGVNALCVAWSPDGKSIASGAGDGAAYIFCAKRGKVIHSIINAHKRAVRSVCFSSNCMQLVTGSVDGFVKIFEVMSGNLQKSLEYKAAVIATMSPDGYRIACGLSDGTVQLLTYGLDVQHTYRNHTAKICGIQFNMDCNKLVTVSKDRSINIYECLYGRNSARRYR